MSHTPGPWQVVEGDGGYTIANPTIDQQSGAEMYDPVVWEMGGIGSEADARLIAAAPDLLAACEGVLRAWPDDESFAPPWLAAVRAAIAKARGE